MEQAIKGLQELQALDLREYLTPLGYHLASLPVNVRISTRGWRTSESSSKQQLDSAPSSEFFEESGCGRAHGSSMLNHSMMMQVRVGKMMLYGTIFRCLDPVLTIAAGLSSRSPFVSPFDKRDEADKAHKAFAIPRSDHLSVLKASCVTYSCNHLLRMPTATVSGLKAWLAAAIPVANPYCGCKLTRVRSTRRTTAG